MWTFAHLLAWKSKQREGEIISLFYAQAIRDRWWSQYKRNRLIIERLITEYMTQKPKCYTWPHFKVIRNRRLTVRHPPPLAWHVLPVFHGLWKTLYPLTHLAASGSYDFFFVFWLTHSRRDYLGYWDEEPGLVPRAFVCLLITECSKAFQNRIVVLGKKKITVSPPRLGQLHHSTWGKIVTFLPRIRHQDKHA